ncbi:hypothetical protein H6F61_20510 [Cyanobacteria bacterium FACHB-472]|nr:hypothetical protein [Cyanobacteria bacterium FACHB-472]
MSKCLLQKVTALMLTCQRDRNKADTVGWTLETQPLFCSTAVGAQIICCYYRW